MLAALLLLGILPLAAMPMMQTDVTVPDDDFDPVENGEPDPAGGDILNEIDEPSDGDSGRFFAMDATPGATVLDDFVPGEDLVRLDLSRIGDGLVFEESDGPEGAAVAFSTSDDSVISLRFPNLSAVPAEDIDLILSEAGGDSFQVNLSDVMAAVEAEIGLDPVDPEEADAEMAEQDTGPGLDPVDPDLPDPPGPDDAGPGLDPVDPDLPDPPGGGGDPGIDPVGPGDEVFGPEGDLALRDLIERDSTAVYGMGAALAAAFESGTDDTALSGDDDVWAAEDDGLPGTGAGSVTSSEGTPVIESGAPVQVVDGADGDDTIATGDGAAFAFGGAGDDVLTGGDGAAALFGGAGADVATLGTAEGGFVDGGAGDDTLTGGAGAETLEGGEHGADVPGDDLIDGGAGDDLIRGGFGADTLSGGDGDDVIDHHGLSIEREIEEHHQFGWHLDGDADFLSGGAGDDTLIMDDEDRAEGGAGQDLFWVYGDGAGAAEILDFEVGLDFLRLSLNPHALPPGVPEVVVETSADGADALVSVNGDLIAILRGAAGATASDVYAEVAADVFPSGS